ncbi:MAG: winged helix-turn-helix domain-containing protein [Promethearchaeota archaeon]
MTRRSKLEIMINVLEVVQNGEKKPTRIMYQSNLSYKLLKDVLESLVNQELITAMEPTTTGRKRDKRTNTLYVITPKGQNVLRYFHNARGMLQIENQFTPFHIS